MTIDLSKLETTINHDGSRNNFKNATMESHRSDISKRSEEIAKKVNKLKSLNKKYYEHIRISKAEVDIPDDKNSVIEEVRETFYKSTIRDIRD